MAMLMGSQDLLDLTGSGDLDARIELIIIPIHFQKAHWFVLALNVKLQNWDVYDSLVGTSRRYHGEIVKVFRSY